MSALADWIASSGALQWLVAYTYIVVFLGTLVDASGVPFPGRLLLAAAGALAATGRRSVVAIIVVAAVAAMVMDHIWYVAGARGSTGVLRLYRRLAGHADDDEAAEYAGRYGAATIVLGRFFTSLRALAWPLAATRGVRYPKFFVLDLFAAILWASVWVLLGWIVAERWRSAAATVGPWLGVAGIIVLAVVLTPVLTRVVRRHRRRRGGRDTLSSD
jgi:membrane protein DedA with SNARE-associated domain